MDFLEVSIESRQAFLFSEGAVIPVTDTTTNMPEELEFSLSGDFVEVAEPLGNYSRDIVDEVWEALEKVSGNDSALWRVDENGSMICKSEYGNRLSSFGWEILETGPGQFQMSANGGHLRASHVDNL